MQYKITREDHIQHHGVKGMKWGVRRYQNKDGTYTNAGKKRLVRDITSKKTSTIEANRIAKNASNSDKALVRWRESESYKKYKKSESDYLNARQKYYDAEDKVWRGVIKDIEKKHGSYEDVIRSGDKDKRSKFDKDYNTLLNKRFKENGIYDLENEKNTKYEAFKETRNTFRNDTRQFIEDYLGDYSNQPLRGQGSAIHRGNEIVDRVKTVDIFVDMFDDTYHL